MNTDRYEQTQRMMATAVRRLNMLEYVMLGMAAALALLGGALAAWGLQAAAGFPFRPSWFVCSLLFFIIPGGIVLGRERWARARTNESSESSQPSETNDV
jgi:uncharacterized membrane protein